LQKRSLTLAGHRTSIALEPEFWDAVEDIAFHRGTSLPALIAEIDETRRGDNLSSAIRLAVLAHYRAGASAPSKDQ